MNQEEKIREVYLGHYKLYRKMVGGEIPPSVFREKEVYYQEMKKKIQKGEKI